MRRTAVSIASALAALTFGAAPALAHHSIAAMYDRDRTVDLDGRIAKVQIVNPHSLLTVEVRARNGALQVWSVEGRGASGMQSIGLDEAVLAEGRPIKLSGNSARNGTRSLWLTKLETAEGQAYDMRLRR